MLNLINFLNKNKKLICFKALFLTLCLSSSLFSMEPGEEGGEEEGRKTPTDQPIVKSFDSPGGSAFAPQSPDRQGITPRSEHLTPRTPDRGVAPSVVVVQPTPPRPDRVVPVLPKPASDRLGSRLRLPETPSLRDDRSPSPIGSRSSSRTPPGGSPIDGRKSPLLHEATQSERGLDVSKESLNNSKAIALELMAFFLEVQIVEDGFEFCKRKIIGSLKKIIQDLDIFLEQVALRKGCTECVTKKRKFIFCRDCRTEIKKLEKPYEITRAKLTEVWITRYLIYRDRVLPYMFGADFYFSNSFCVNPSRGGDAVRFTVAGKEFEAFSCDLDIVFGSSIGVVECKMPGAKSSSSQKRHEKGTIRLFCELDDDLMRNCYDWQLDDPTVDMIEINARSSNDASRKLCSLLQAEPSPVIMEEFSWNLFVKQALFGNNESFIGNLVDLKERETLYLLPPGVCEEECFPHIEHDRRLQELFDERAIGIFIDPCKRFSFVVSRSSSWARKSYLTLKVGYLAEMPACSLSAEARQSIVFHSTYLGEWVEYDEGLLGRRLTHKELLFKWIATIKALSNARTVRVMTPDRVIGESDWCAGGCWRPCGEADVVICPWCFELYDYCSCRSGYPARVYGSPDDGSVGQRSPLSWWTTYAAP